MKKLRILIIGDVVGPGGRSMFQKHSDALRRQYSADAVIVNGENSSSTGRGISSRIVRFFKHNGANMITSGNHIWANKEIFGYLDEHKDLLRPENYPSSCPGTGIGTFTVGEVPVTVGVLNLQGRIFMREHVDDPFRVADSALTYLKQRTPIVIVDFHAEASSEKIALAHYLAGRVSAVVGTHTHVQTADNRILPGGTAYITDLGMTGPYDGMIGMQKEPIMRNFLTQMPQKFHVETTGTMIMCGVCVEIDPASGSATMIERIQVLDADIQVTNDKD